LIVKGHAPNIISEIANKVFEYSQIYSFLNEKISFDENKEKIDINGKNINIGKRKIYLVAVGKASLGMTQFFIERIPERIEETILVIPKGTDCPSTLKKKAIIIQSSHPIPDDNSIKAGETVLNLARKLTNKDVLLFLVSGGGSSLMEKPIPPITLRDLIKTNKILLSSGMSIDEINVVRKHLSEVKGGKLAKKAYPALTITLAASDVPGDRIDLIASGPTAPDPSTYTDTKEILKEYGVYDSLPETVKKVIEEGISGKIPETPKPNDTVFENVHNIVIARPIDVLRKLESFLAEKKYNTYILTSSMAGESKEVARFLSSIITDIKTGKSVIKKPAAILLGGETSVTVKHKGWGGRNTELVAWLSRYLSGEEVCFLSVDTDGIDGNSPVAGGWGTGKTWKKSLDKLGEKALEYLTQNNTYLLLEKTEHTIETGPTGTNLNSITIILANCKNY